LSDTDARSKDMETLEIRLLLKPSFKRCDLGGSVYPTVVELFRKASRALVVTPRVWFHFSALPFCEGLLAPVGSTAYLVASKMLVWKAVLGANLPPWSVQITPPEVEPWIARNALTSSTGGFFDFHRNTQMYHENSPTIMR
jgi:hypothetical protein